MYIAHPSFELQRLFARKPFQGVDPNDATFLFIGLDANYDEHIALNPIFPKVLDYHDDAVEFWRRTSVHHPFLLPEYSGDGRFYHRSFARIGFGTQHASSVSFVELLDVPTVGRSKLVVSDLDPAHLKMLNRAILNGKAKYVFAPGSVAGLMQKTGEFPWLPKAPTKQAGSLPVWFRAPGKTVYSHLHFSVYGKYEQKKVDEATLLRGLLSRSDARTEA